MSFLRLSIQKILYQLLLLLVCYTAFRWLFYAFNAQELERVQEGQFLTILGGGLRFDLSALAFLNSLWILLTLIFPLNIKNRVGKFLISLSFYLPNIVAILFEVSDWVYFNFNRKRATIEIFDLIFSKGDFLNLLPSYLQKFWYVPLIAASFIVFIIWSHKRLNRYFAEQWALFKSLEFKQTKIHIWIFQPICILLSAGLVVLCMRGGLQLIPINARNAVEYVNPEQAALVLNTPFSIITSVESARLKAVDFMPEEKADAIIKPVKQYHFENAFKKKNVVFIVWESFSKRFTAIDSNTKSVTPFFDSLCQKSIVFSNAFSNALRSNEGVPAVFSGIPAMMDGPVITSIYTNNQFGSLPFLMAQEGYQTAFFHGGNNGTMSLDTYAKNAGFQKYIGRSEYGTNKDYDGAWGVWDKPFLQYSLAGMDALKSPFFAGLFTLSSHVPFNVPKDFLPSSPNTQSDVERSMNYTDQALSDFFKVAATKPWFDNTVFVVVADHGCPLSDDAFYIDGLGRYQIPIVIYEPGKLDAAQNISTLMQQIDIKPTLLDYLAYNKPFFALGNSAFDASAFRFNFNYLSGNYRLISTNYFVKTNAYAFASIFKYPEDIKGNENVIDAVKNNSEIEMLNQQFKAFLQILNNGMINDRLSVETYQSKQDKK